MPVNTTTLIRYRNQARTLAQLDEDVPVVGLQFIAVASDEARHDQTDVFVDAVTGQFGLDRPGVAAAIARAAHLDTEPPGRPVAIAACQSRLASFARAA